MLNIFLSMKIDKSSFILYVNKKITATYCEDWKRLETDEMVTHTHTSYVLVYVLCVMGSRWHKYGKINPFFYCHIIYNFWWFWVCGKRDKIWSPFFFWWGRMIGQNWNYGFIKIFLIKWLNANGYNLVSIFFAKEMYKVVAYRSVWKERRALITFSLMGSNYRT